MSNAPPPGSRATTALGAPARNRAEDLVSERGPGLRAAPIDNSDAWTITLEGEIDAAAVTRLQQEMTDALTGYDRIVVDLGDVRVLSTPTLALLCCALRHAYRQDAGFVIAGAAPAARRALRLCELPGLELHPPTAPSMDQRGAGRDHEELVNVGQLLSGLHGRPVACPL